MQPSDFRVNETWLAYRINQAPMQIEGQDVDLYVLQDAASMFLFGNLLAPHGADYPDAEEIEKLMMSAHKKRDEWPVELFLPGSHLSDNSFAKIAKKHGCSKSGVFAVLKKFEEHLIVRDLPIPGRPHAIPAAVVDKMLRALVRGTIDDLAQ